MENIRIRGPQIRETDAVHEPYPTAVSTSICMDDIAAAASAARGAGIPDERAGGADASGHGQHTVDRIAAQTGFSSTSNFRAHFTQTVGVTPSGYRTIFRA